MVLYKFAYYYYYGVRYPTLKSGVHMSFVYAYAYHFPAPPPKSTPLCNTHRFTNLFQHHPELVELGNDALPVDASRADDVIQLEDDVSVRQVAVEVTDVRRHAHRVHPVAIH